MEGKCLGGVEVKEGGVEGGGLEGRGERGEEHMFVGGVKDEWEEGRRGKSGGKET